VAFLSAWVVERDRWKIGPRVKRCTRIRPNITPDHTPLGSPPLEVVGLEKKKVKKSTLATQRQEEGGGGRRKKERKK